ncbi:MAG TPA: hypothetical protein VD884_18905 [Ohtaekwangia sp.]|nr:hypothetical protein [Ohtaekwangia sp.]
MPWLTKKLCIHIFDQINSGLAKEDLIESNLNIVDLFTKDEERLTSSELKAIKLIAKRAYDGNFFDETEVGDVIDGGTITSLLHKRLIIRSGANYNIYWDIYRDYLVTGKIPTIGESFLLRQGVNLCLEVFLLFENEKQLTIDALLNKHPKGIGSETLYNILIELRNLGIVQKSDSGYSVSNAIAVSKDSFINFITAKFQNYTPYLNLKKINLPKIGKNEVIVTLKAIFKQDFQDNTWNVYAVNLINWFLFSNLDIKPRLLEPTKGRGSGTNSQVRLVNKDLYVPRCSLREIADVLPLLLSDISLIDKGQKRDLVTLGVLSQSRALTEFGLELMKQNEHQIQRLLKERMLTFPKMSKLNSLKQTVGKITAKGLINKMPKDFFPGEKESSKMIYASKALSWVK